MEVGSELLERSALTGAGGDRWWRGGGQIWLKHQVHRRLGSGPEAQGLRPGRNAAGGSMTAAAAFDAVATEYDAARRRLVP